MDRRKPECHRSEVVEYDIPANQAMDRCSLILERLREGIEVLAVDDRSLAAFRFANRAMASQRIHSLHALVKRRGDAVTLDALNIRKNRSCDLFSWRSSCFPFLRLPTPLTGTAPNRWRPSPTCSGSQPVAARPKPILSGGLRHGIRRLQGEMGGLNGGRGLAVIMRYTLRLLTLQQFNEPLP